MPIEKQQGGNLLLEETDVTGGIHVSVVLPGTGTYVSHFANCKQAEQWRKPK